jgi:CHAT domain-containing protein
MRKGLFLIVFLCSSGFLHSRIIRVPQDYYTIKSAISSARDGDIVEVGDGYYFEKNIIVTKNIRIHAKNPFGAVVSGTGTFKECIFIIRAKAEIDGFVLRDSSIGLEQRDGPDVAWRAHDLALINFHESGISINDFANNNGSGEFKNIIIDNCGTGINTNDANSIEIENALIFNCDSAFVGSNHINFHVAHTLTWNCAEITRLDHSPVKFPATHRIQTAPDVFFLERILVNSPGIDLASYVEQFFEKSGRELGSDSKYKEKWRGLLNLIMGEVFFQKKAYPQAHQSFVKSIELSERSNFKEVLWRSNYGAALYAHNSGDIQSTYRYYQKAINAIDSIIEGLPIWFFKPNFFLDKKSVYESFIDLLFNLHQKDPKHGFDREAFLLAEKIKASSVLSGIMEFQTKETVSEIPEFQKKEAAIKHRISTIQKSLLQISGSRRQRLLLEELEDAEDEFIASLIQRKRRVDDKDAAHDWGPSSAGDIQKYFLGDKTAIVEYFLGDTAGYVFLLTQGSFHFLRLDHAAELRELVNNYLMFLAYPQPWSFSGAAGGRKLFSRLISPFIPYLNQQISNLIIVPDGILQYLPFETLVYAVNPSVPPPPRLFPKGPPFIIYFWEINYAPSASFQLKPDFLMKQQIERMDLLAVSGRPDVRFPDWNSFRSAITTALPGSKKEVKSIVDFFRPKRTVALIGRSSTEAALKKQPLDDFKIVHFAAHAILDDGNWVRSSLILGSDPTDKEDGFLQPIDIIGLHFNASLVTLATCRNADKRLEDGEGFLGLSLPFLLTGTRTVVSALWSIDDRATTELMNSFYSEISKGRSKGSALRAAKLTLLRSTRNHPFYWGGFILTGEADRAVDFSR